MLKNYFKIAWRNVVRHKAHSIINISGLSVGVAACLLIFVILQFERSFNTSYANYKNIYHIITKQVADEGIFYNPGVSVPAIDALRTDFPQYKFAALNTSYGSQITVPDNSGNNGTADKKFTEGFGVFFIEPQFFDIFHSTWLEGDKKFLAEPNMVVLDKRTATKYFGDWKKATGKNLKMDNLLSLRVAGVVDNAPDNSDFPLRVMVSYITLKQNANTYGFRNDWHSLSSNHQIFTELPANVNPDNFTKQLVGFTNKQSDLNQQKQSRIHLLQPLSELHFDTRVGNTVGDHITSRATLNTLTFIAVLIIIMASINFINLSTAQSVGRSKEVGIRKVLGSTRKQLIAQVIGETTLVIMVSVLLAVAIAKIALPYLKNIASVPDEIALFSTGTVLFLIVITIVVILLSGIYPALVVSGFKPVQALKNKITAASIGGIPLRRALVVAQFAIAQLLIIGTIVAVNQMNFVNEADLGFNKNAVLIIPGSADSLSLSKMQAFKQQLLLKPEVKSVSFASDAPSSENNWGQNFYYDHSEKDPQFNAFLKYGDADYFKTFELRFAAGKGYDPSDTIRQLVVNETFIHKLGIKKAGDAIGKAVRMGARGTWAPITGVVEDFKTNSLRDAVKPIVISPLKKFESVAAVKIQTKNLTNTVASIQKLWESTYPEYAYNGYFLDENIAQFYKQENQLALVYKIFAFIAIFISCLGLYGLVSFMAVQRTKEVGVRKVLGASVFNIVLLFSKEFMILIAIAFVLAMPAAWYLMSGWLQNFAYRINLTAGVFVLAIASSLAIACLTVGYKAIKAALVNPVKSLRSE
ncbi:ABC transporter permease [Mucilaginibacter phyllosphaerae]|uniref:Permease n=1 Tax=Mucilaginibacter phyllosphaerae TaxID=1812349 RepID=A0A4Y8A7B3_9SPHI|nr:ABC transporter permease [Mucilaginibacter phyllosphaerae]MBB3970790.1 putative permease [Mucilaginibacter phyllosphaerae]TEW64269.1 ABC transporter permease [Mucilaginibacter phyllosphaerae]GGH04600.1 ABC transporter permease [Mucilaginibacter phyllosphaerae]